MADFDRLANPIGKADPFKRLGISFGRPPTQFEQEIQPHIATATEEVDRERSRIRPLQFVFNLLQTGQFFSAGIAEEITQSFRTGEPLGQAAEDAVRAALKGVGAGLTGQTPEGQASTFEDVIYGRKEEDGTIVRGWAGYVPKEDRTFQQKAVGFVADVFLDPANLVTFGAPQAARAAAARFAKDATSVWLQRRGGRFTSELGNAIKTGRKGDLDKALTQLSADEPLRRQVHDVYNDAFKQALFVPRGADPEKFADELASGLRTQLEETGRVLDAPEAIVHEGAPHLADLMESINKGYGKAGLREARFLGMPFHQGVRPPNVAIQAFNTFRSRFSKTIPGQKMEDAWWAIHNGESITPAGRKIREVLGLPQHGFGTVALLRKAFGFFQDPFEKMLRVEGRFWSEGEAFHTFNNKQEVASIRGELDDDATIRLTDAFARAFEDTGGDVAISPGDLLRLEGEPGLAEAADRFQDLTNRWFAEENQIAQTIGSLVEYSKELNHFPKGFAKDSITRGPGELPQLGRQVEGVTRQAQGTLQDALSRNRARLREVLGPALNEAAESTGKTGDEILNELIIKNGWGDTELDIFKAMELRGHVNARIKARSQMVQAMREFGIPTDQLPPQMQQALSGGGKIRELELSSVADPAFEGMAFDSDVADVINRVFQANSNDGIQGLKRWWSWTTSVFKGFATTTPRFHLRNFVSNHMTGFLKNGVRWLNPVAFKDSLISSVYALNPARHIDILTQDYNVPQGMIARTLNKRIGGQSLREWADEARELGVISVRGSVSQDIGQSFLERTPVFKHSRIAGDVIENQARMQSFLIDMEQMGGARGAKEWAAIESKKWFLDYGDLTEFEQRFMRNIIPFYTFMRKNIANQLAGLTLHGDLYAVVAKAVDSVAADEDFDYELLEEWQNNLFLFPVWQDRENQKSLLIDPIFAFQDINRMLPVFFEPGSPMPKFDRQELSNEILSSAHPIVKTITELATGVDVFRRREIRKWEVAPRIIQAMGQNPALFQFMDGLLKLANQDSGIGLDMRPDGVVMMDGVAQRAIDNNLPLLSTIARGFDLVDGVRGLTEEGLDDLIAEASQETDYNSTLQTLLRGLAFMTGVRLRQFDMEEAERKRSEDIFDKARDELQRSRRNLPGFEQRSAAGQERRRQQLQRLGL